MPVEKITKMEATNADTMLILHGETDEPQVMSVPERREDSFPVYVRRLYEPTEVVELPETMEDDEVQEWIEENEDHPALSDIDFEEWRDRALLQTVVDNRRNYVEFLTSLYEELDEIPTNDTMAQKGIGGVQESIENAVSQYVIEIDRVDNRE